MLPVQLNRLPGLYSCHSPERTGTACLPVSVGSVEQVPELMESERVQMAGLPAAGLAHRESSRSLYLQLLPPVLPDHFPVF